MRVVCKEGELILDGGCCNSDIIFRYWFSLCYFDFTVRVYPALTDTEAPGDNLMLLTVTFELTTIEPLSITTSVFSSGKEPQLQFASFSQFASIPAVHLFLNVMVIIVLIFPSTTQRYRAPYFPACSLLIFNVLLFTPE